jgi:hypothetical protein
MIISPALTWKNLFKDYPLLVGTVIVIAALKVIMDGIRAKDGKMVMALLWILFAILPLIGAYYGWNFFFMYVGYAFLLAAWATGAGCRRLWIWGTLHAVYFMTTISFALNWAYAAQQTRPLLDQGIQILSRTNAKTLIILTLPSQYRQEGLIFPYCYETALQLLGQKAVVQVLTGISISEPKEHLDVRKISGGYELSTQNAGSYFEFPGNLGWITKSGNFTAGTRLKSYDEEIEIKGLGLHKKPNRLTIHFPAPLGPDTIVASYSEEILSVQ